MPYQRKTLTQLRLEATQDLQAAPVTGPGGDAIDPSLPGVAEAITWSHAGFAWGHYDYMDYIAQQAVPWTATAPVVSFNVVAMSVEVLTTVAPGVTTTWDALLLRAEVMTYLLLV